MPDLFTTLGQWKLSRGYLSALIRGEGGDFMAPGSENAMVTGQGLVRAFKGPRHLSTLAGSRIFFNTDQSYAGLGNATIPGAILTTALADGGNSYVAGDTGTIDTGDANAAYEVLTVDGSGAVLTYDVINPGTGYSVRDNATTTVDGAQPGTGVGFAVDISTVSGAGKGSVFKVQDLLCYIGDGQVAFEGAYLAGIIASSILSLVKKSGGVYAAGPLTGPFQAGHAQPPAPTIYAKTPSSPGLVTMNSAVSVVVWRISSITGQVSLMSEPSNVVTTTGSVVVQINEPVDTNGQDFWGIGVVKISFADLGWYYELPTSLNGEVRDVDLATVAGHTRSVEIAWTNGHLLGQNTAPDKAFPPVEGDFAGAMNDVAWIDADGIIYVSEPGFIGSMPPSNALFASEAAVRYLKVNDGLTVRLGKATVGTLYYVGGSPALEYQTILENQGIEFAPNAAIGANGRLLAWFGKPTVVDNDAEPDFDYSRDVSPEFEGWDSQTADQPIVVGYDGLGKYECWIWKQKCMAKFVPDNTWCSPIYFTIGSGDNEVIGDVISAVTFKNKLYICCSDGSELAIYQFDAGSGSVMKIQTSDFSRMGFFSNISLVMVEGRVDNIDNRITIEVIKNYVDADPIADPLSDFVATPTGVGTQNFCPRQPNVLDVNQHAVKVTIVSTGGDAGVNLIKTMGANFDLLNHQCNAGTLPQVITFEPIEDQFVDAPDFLISATATSGLTVHFLPGGNCEVVDNDDGTATVHMTGDEGICSVTATQGGNGVYDPAPDVTQEFTAIKRDQSIDFAFIPDKIVSDVPFLISATATSGLIVAFAFVSGPGSLVDHGDGTATVTLTGINGDCEISTSQDGDGTYNAAPDVSQVFSVSTPGIPDFTLVADYDICAHGAPTLAVIGSETWVTNNTPSGGSQAQVFTGAITLNGTVEFRFPTFQDLSALVWLRYELPADCALIEDSTTDRGWEILLSGSGGSITCNARENAALVTQFLGMMPWDADTVYKIVIEAGVPKFFENNVLKFTGPNNASGANIRMGVRVEGGNIPLKHSEAAILRWSPNAYV